MKGRLLNALLTIEEFINRHLHTNKIQWCRTLPYDIKSHGAFTPPDNIHVQRDDINISSNVPRDIAVMLHEFGHFVSHIYQFTSYDYWVENSGIVILVEELIAWFLAFIILYNIKLGFFTKIIITLTTIYYFISFFKTYLKMYLPKAGIVQW